MDPILEQKGFIELHSGALTILLLTTLVLGTLLVLVPQLLRAHLRALEMLHNEHMRTLDQGHIPPAIDEQSRAAGRMALLVPTVVLCAAATVTCFLVAYNSEHIFAVSLAAWCVAGVVSLAAITGGVALLGRLAAINAGVQEEQDESVDEPLLK